jgi:hypothetical protein
MSKPKILITGGTGTVGKHLSNLGLDAVYVSSAMCNFTDTRDSDDFFKSNKPDIVVHLAAKVGGMLDNINNPVDYLDRAQKWMKQIGTPFAGFINESLSSYLTNERDKSVLRERQEKFLAKLEEAITDGAPLVNINQGLLSKIHDSKPTTDVVISTIPLDTNNDIFSKVGEILEVKVLQSEEIFLIT